MGAGESWSQVHGSPPMILESSTMMRCAFPWGPEGDSQGSSTIINNPPWHLTQLLLWIGCFQEGFPTPSWICCWLTVDRLTHCPPGGQVECAVLGPGVFERDLAGKCGAWTQYRFLRFLLSAGLTHRPSTLPCLFLKALKVTLLEGKQTWGGW